MIDRDKQPEESDEPESDSIYASHSSGWCEDEADSEQDPEIDEYSITATPNDFNVLTILSFIDSGAVKIPAFQRNYVWDIRRASKLIESLILGLPVPQVFLYEEGRNSFLVIDGQQRIMSIYYFMKQRFPRREKRGEIREIFDKFGRIPDEILHSDEFFMDFKLRFGSNVPALKNRFAGRRYSTLQDYKSSFDLRPIRNIIVKQSSPDESDTEGYDSAVFEIFHRLNTGGVNLTAQEIRASLYHSPFYDALYKMNTDVRWRSVLNTTPDLHMKDIEVLLRGFAMLLNGDQYKSSMLTFLNVFSKKAKRFDTENLTFLTTLFDSFLSSLQGLPRDVFLSRISRRFNVALFEAVFVGSCTQALKERRRCSRALQQSEIETLLKDKEFEKASVYGTTNSVNVSTRLRVARRVIPPC